MRNRKIPFSGGLADIAVATASIFDEVSGDFSAQKPVKLNRLGYISSLEISTKNSRGYEFIINKLYFYFPLLD